MRYHLSRLIVLGFVFVCVGARAQAAHAAPFDLIHFFEGRFKGSGTFTDIQHPGPLTVTFAGRGRPIAGGLNLDYVLAFSDGERRHVTWTFLEQAGNRYIGRRSDILGDAQVVPDGDGFAMSYTGRVATKSGRTVNLKFNEQYTMTGPNQIENTVRASLFIVPVVNGDVIIRKVGR